MVSCGKFRSHGQRFWSSSIAPVTRGAAAEVPLTRVVPPFPSETRISSPGATMKRVLSLLASVQLVEVDAVSSKQAFARPVGEVGDRAVRSDRSDDKERGIGGKISRERLRSGVTPVVAGRDHQNLARCRLGHTGGIESA